MSLLPNTHTRSIYVFIKAMFSFIFTSLTAVHIYDFHIIKKHRKKKKEEKQRERSFSHFPLYVLRFLELSTRI